MYYAKYSGEKKECAGKEMKRAEGKKEKILSKLSKML